ncbi:MAG: hypothetical protein QNJ44_20945 [Rhodobacter sp.]|nr:hypothetical protein [Rhodobacter sp.]
MTESPGRWLIRCAPERAQAQVNFRLLEPKDLLPEQLSLRREGPPISRHPAPQYTRWSNWCGAHTSSVSFEIPLGDMRLRCKQYLYDLGPLSTLDCAALYDQSADSMAVNPLSTGGVAWVGVDYAGLPAVTWLQHGTNVELRCLSGRFDLDRVLDLADGFASLDVAAQLPFSKRSYWARHDRYDIHLARGIYHPPSSLWRFRWPWLAVDHHWSDDADVICAGLSSAVGSSWQFDGTCCFGVPPAETITRFIAADSGCAVLWVRQFRAHEASIPDPHGGIPTLDRHSGFSAFEITQTYEQNLRLITASRSRRVGPHDTVAWKGSWGYLVQQSSYAAGDLQTHLQLARRITRVLA